MDSSYFREIIRTVTVSYRVPFIFAGLLAVFFFSFTGASVLHEPMNWIFAAAGIIAFLVAVGIARYGVVWRPDLLRRRPNIIASDMCHFPIVMARLVRATYSRTCRERWPGQAVP